MTNRLKKIAKSELSIGDNVVFYLGGEACKVMVVGGEQICVQRKNGELMLVSQNDAYAAPLCTANGKAVYPGDTLYWFDESVNQYKEHIACRVECHLGINMLYDDNDEWLSPGDCLWEKPTVEKEAWLNIYIDPTDPENLITGNQCWSKHAADQQAKDAVSVESLYRIDCIKITWEV